MPLTPFHLGPALLAGVLLYRWLDLPTLLAASVVIDVRASLVVFGPLDGPTHGILTTFVGATTVALVVAVGVRALPDSAQSGLDVGRLAPTAALGPVLAAALVGSWSHVVLDSLLYADAQPFWPLAANPLRQDGVILLPVYRLFKASASGLDPEVLHGGCLVAGLAGTAGFTIRWWRTHTAES